MVLGASLSASESGKRKSLATVFDPKQLPSKKRKTGKYLQVHVH
jgi:hypothetical protein